MMKLQYKNCDFPKAITVATTTTKMCFPIKSTISLLLLLFFTLPSKCLSSSGSISASVSSSQTPATVDHGEQRCEKITIPMCMDIGYNLTSMPNLLEMETQEEAGLEVHQFWPLVEINCSEDLKFFLCSMYAPICIEDYHGHIPSCQSVCERAREGCTPIMIQYGFNWPDKMNCSELPVYGDGYRICMDPKKGAGMDNHQASSNNGNVPEESTPIRQKPGKHSKNNNNKNPHHHALPPPSQPMDIFYNPDKQSPPTVSTNEIPYNVNGFDNDDQMTATIIPVEKCRCDCLMPYFIKLRDIDLMILNKEQAAQSIAYNYHDHHEHSHHVHQQSMQYFNHSQIETAGGLAPMCAVSCKGAYHFNDQEHESAMFWINVAASICCILCLFTVFTSMTDTQRFRYPERAIIFLAACYILISSGYLLRIHLGPEAIACDGPFIRYQRTGPTPTLCLLSFILLYFFGMASAYWWLILTLTWFLAAGLKWSSEAITSYAQYFHLFAWLLPMAQSVVILCLGAIDGDPFVNVCTVGNQSRFNLLVFVITPLCVCIAIGVLFLLAGLIELFRIRRAIRQTQHTIRVKTDKLEKLMIRIGLSSSLYIVAEVVVVACHIYEYINRPFWEKSLTCVCTNNNNEHYSPQFTLIVLKYIMSLIIGITPSFWIFSTKTFESWMKIYTKITCCSGPFGSPASSRSGASQLLPAGYYNRGAGNGLTVNSSSAPMKMQTVNLGPMSVPQQQSQTPQHHLHHIHQHHHQVHQSPHSHHPLHHNSHHHHFNELQSSRQGSMILPPPPSIPPPPPPPMMMNNGHGTGSITGSQFAHLIGSINGGNSGSNHHHHQSNSKHPLSHV